MLIGRQVAPLVANFGCREWIDRTHEIAPLNCQHDFGTDLMFSGLAQVDDKYPVCLWLKNNIESLARLLQRLVSPWE